MMRPRTALVAALPEELEEVRAHLTERQWHPGPGRMRAQTGRLSDVPVVLVVTGDGAPATEAGMDWALKTFCIEQVLSVGLAGALSPQVPVGAVVVAQAVLRAGGSPLRCESEWFHCAQEAGVTPAVVVSAARLAGSEREKQALWAECAAGAPAVVDLESWTIALAAARAGLPWGVLRAVSDGHDEALPGFLLAAQDESGAVSRRKVVGHALWHPGAVPELLALRRRTKGCARALAGRLEELLGAWRTSPG